MSAELKPCPFCGRPGTFFSVRDTEGGTHWAVDCENADCAVCASTNLYSTKTEAADAWNRRAE